jgi:hypothetical protein
VVKLFKRKKDQKTANFKFDGSIKLKDLPIEEYAHVANAFQVSVLKFERMLKESLLEGYITSTTLEKISQEFKISMIRELAIPETESLALLFGGEPPITTKTQQVPTLEEKVKIPEEPAVSTPDPTPKITPEVPTVPETVSPEPVVAEPAVKPSEVPEISAPIPKISFSIPSPASTSESSPEPPEQTQPTTPDSSLKAPTIPKISFPASPSSSSSPLSNPLANIRGRKEEDRATGIAILRKQMLTELKKIRSVVAEQDQ